MLPPQFLNGYKTEELGPTDCPRGWDKFDALVEPYVYAFYGPAFSLNCAPSVKLADDQYSTDVIKDKAISYIR